MQTGAGKGSTQDASQDSSCGASQESTGSLDRCWQRKHSRRFPRQQLRCLLREHWNTGPVLAKEALKALPKTAGAVPPKRALDLRKFQWEKHKQGELEVLPKRVLTCFQSMYVSFIGLRLTKTSLTLINRTRLRTKGQSAGYPQAQIGITSNSFQRRAP